MALPTQTTLLSAVNTCLRIIQEAPVSSLNAPFSDDVGFCLDTINEILVEALGRGYTFNLEGGMELILDTDGKYAIPANVLRIELYGRHHHHSHGHPHNHSHGHWHLDLVPRDDAGTMRLYDRVHHTFVLHPGIHAAFVYAVDFNDCPEPFRRYVTIRAARTFQARLQGGEASVYSQREELMAQKALRDYEVGVHPRNLFQNWAVGRVIARDYPDTGYGPYGGWRGGFRGY